MVAGTQCRAWGSEGEALGLAAGPVFDESLGSETGDHRPSDPRPADGPIRGSLAASAASAGIPTDLGTLRPTIPGFAGAKFFHRRFARNPLPAAREAVIWETRE